MLDSLFARYCQWDEEPQFSAQYNMRRSFQKTLNLFSVRLAVWDTPGTTVRIDYKHTRRRNVLNMGKGVVVIKYLSVLKLYTNRFFTTMHGATPSLPTFIKLSWGVQGYT